MPKATVRLDSREIDRVFEADLVHKDWTFSDILRSLADELEKPEFAERLFSDSILSLKVFPD